jgi:predicted aspartyl protease
VRSLLAFALGSLFLVGVSSSAARAQTPPEFPAPVLVPFELESGFLIVVRGQIGTVGALRFILDTGATRSVIDAKLAKRLRLPRLEDAATHTYDKIASAKMTVVSDLRIGPLAVRSLPVLVMKLANVSSYAEDIDGLIGLDFLSQSKAFTIDYQAKTVSFDLAEGKGYRPNPVGCLLMQLNIQGLPVDLVVDTGLPGIVLYQNKLHDRFPGLRVSKDVKPIKMGRLHLASARLPDVSLNGAAADRNVYFIDENPKRAVPGIDGAIGPIALNARELKFDFVGRQLLLH